MHYLIIHVLHNMFVINHPDLQPSRLYYYTSEIHIMLYFTTMHFMLVNKFPQYFCIFLFPKNFYHHITDDLSGYQGQISNFHEILPKTGDFFLSLVK